MGGRRLHAKGSVFGRRPTPRRAPARVPADAFPDDVRADDEELAALGVEPVVLHA